MTQTQSPAPVQINRNKDKMLAGSRNDEFSHTLLMQVVGSLWLGNSTDEERAPLIRSAAHALESIKPSDEVEGMLGIQMVATHNAAMECMRRAMIKEQSFESRDSNLKHAAKLTKSYTDLLAALQKYRGKGQQKVTVEHVHVHQGGQAIVGNVEKRKL